MKNNKTPSYIKVGILTIITAFAWIFFGVYRTLTAKPAPNVPPQILEPFSPTLDTEKLGAIEAKVFFEEGQAPIFSATSPSPSPTPESQPTEIPLETPVPEESPIESTGSGEITP